MEIYGLITIILIVAGAIIVVGVRADFGGERAYGLLALALLAIASIGYLWTVVLSADAQVGSWGTDGLMIGMIVAIYTFATILAIGLLGVVGLIEMAVLRRWRWFAGLLAAMVLLVALIFLPIFSYPLALFPLPNSLVLRDANWLVSEVVVLIVCVWYGIRATWFRPAPAA